MGHIIIFGSILLYILGLTITNGLSVPDSQFFMTEEVRVKRQAGYVYNRPNVPFDLPARAPVPPPTQAPTVDRTQAQMMYYAYPAPAPAPAPGGAPAATNTPAATGGSSAGYNYGAQAQGGGVAQTGVAQSSGTAQAVGVQAAGAAGYSYNTPVSNSGSNAGGGQTSSSGMAQANTGAQTGLSSDSSGYSYDVPNATPAPQPNPGSDGVSTNAPKYLPPVGEVDVRGVDAGSAPAAAAGSSGSTSSGSPGYGAGGGPAAVPPVTDQYLPPLTQSNTENTLPSPNVNTGANTAGQTNIDGTVGGPSAAYIPPGPQRPPSSDVTPRPFAPPPPPSPGGYLPPVDANTSPNQGSLSTPASTYLPPVL